MTSRVVCVLNGDWHCYHQFGWFAFNRLQLIAFGVYCRLSSCSTSMERTSPSALPSSRTPSRCRSIAHGYPPQKPWVTSKGYSLRRCSRARCSTVFAPRVCFWVRSCAGSIRPSIGWDFLLVSKEYSIFHVVFIQHPTPHQIRSHSERTESLEHLPTVVHLSLPRNT